MERYISKYHFLLGLSIIFIIFILPIGSAKNLKNMKIKHALIYLAVGYCFDFVGALYKILHYEYGDQLLVVGTVFKVVGLMLFVVKLLTHPKAKEFLNW
jgi:hypothetical protein